MSRYSIYCANWTDVSLFFLCPRDRVDAFPFPHDPTSTFSYAFSAHLLYNTSWLVAEYPAVRVGQIQVTNSLSFIEPRRENGHFRQWPLFSTQLRARCGGLQLSPV